MASTRVYILAKELGVKSSAIVKKCQSEGLEVKNHMSVISTGLAATIREWFSEGESVRFTRSKDGRRVYAFLLAWPGESLHLRSIQAEEGSDIVLLGHDQPLAWASEADGLHIQLPPELEEAGGVAWVFRIDEAP